MIEITINQNPRGNGTEGHRKRWGVNVGHHTISLALWLYNFCVIAAEKSEK